MKTGDDECSPSISDPEFHSQIENDHTVEFEGSVHFDDSLENFKIALNTVICFWIYVSS